MGRQREFSEVLKEFMERAGFSSDRLSRESKIPRPTINNWLKGTKPRDWQAVIKLALALELEEKDASILLQAAGHLPIPALLQLNLVKEDHNLLGRWNIQAPLARVSPENQRQQSDERIPEIPPAVGSENTDFISDIDKASTMRRFRHRPDFVGRMTEIKRFEEVINKFEKNKQRNIDFPTVLLISGEGGMGKSWLVNELCAIAEDKNLAVLFTSFDLATSFDNEGLPEGLLSSMVQQAKEAGLKNALEGYDLLRLNLLQLDLLQNRDSSNMLQLSTVTGHNLFFEGLDPATTNYQIGYLGSKIIDRLAREVTRGLNKASLEKPIVLVIDAYEKAKEVDRWIRSQLSVLEGRIIIVVSSQRDVETEFIGTFNRLAVQHWKLGSFSIDECEKYLQACRITNTPTSAKNVFRISQGIPLAVAVCATSIDKIDTPIDHTAWEGNALESETVEKVVRYWLTDLPKKERDILFVMSSLRYFNDECLKEILQHEISIIDYSNIYSFITLHKLGWEVHDRIRIFIINYMKRNRLDYYIDINIKAEKYWDKKATELKKHLDPNMYVLSIEWGNAMTTKLYHLIQVDEDKGLSFLLENFWEGIKLRFFFSSLVEVLGNQEISLDFRFSRTQQVASLLQSIILTSKNGDKTALKSTLDELIKNFPYYLSSNDKVFINNLIENLSQGLDDLVVIKSGKC